jgi:Predicted P-loop-containing kinase
MHFIIVTGMSGAGKTIGLKMLEDMGYFCVDNLPINLVSKFAELAFSPNSEIEKVALGIDIRSGQVLLELQNVLENMVLQGYKYEILFLDASDLVLVKRYKESRRLHPLAQADRIEIGIQKEREQLDFLKKQADYLIDTSNLLTRELKGELNKIFNLNNEFKNIMITILTFGFKYGIPSDSDLVFDVRFLPNPYYIEDLKKKTGDDKSVQDYVMGYDVSHTFINKLEDMMHFLIPNYVLEGKNQLIISIGCTGGKHRSVTLANCLYDRLKKDSEYGVRIEHRDIKKG